MITSLDLFSGAGGFTLGLKNAGIKTIGAIELDRFASETFRKNFPEIPHYQANITEYGDSEIIKLFKGVDIITGGPPCQGFSVAGPSQYGIIDNRNNLIMEMYRFASILKPNLVILENVKGILNGKLSPTKKALDEYMNNMSNIGYKIKVFVLNTSDFGVPQGRQRVFVIAARNEAFIPLEIIGEYTQGKKAKRTVGEALEDLPLIDSGEGVEDAVTYPFEAKTDYQKWLREGSIGVYNHVAMKHTKRLIERFKHIDIGQSLKDVNPEHGQRARNGQELDVRKRFKMNNQRLNPLGISTAITASFQSNFIHPYLNRNLTAREGARLQSFPDKFIFCGPRTLMSKKLLEREGRLDEIGLSQYNQIGNAVPPLLAEAIGKTVLDSLNKSSLKTQG
uniref:Cytosine-specific methyltransferase n=1 Tax=Bacillus pumilus TaxID=1408 RepID=O52850_BACPU|nr:Bpu10I (5m)cytosine-specific DNA modification methyltransferase (C2) [Bacillus pumilus]